VKKFTGLLVVGVSTLVLSGCGGGGGSSETTIYNVDILNLNLGYLLTGLNENSDIVEIEFCGNIYDEYINYVHNINGAFEVNDVYVDFDYIGDTQYDYYIDTTPTEYNFVVGDIYDIYDAQSDLVDSLEITSIERIDCF